MDGAEYDENGLRIYSKEEIQQRPGHYDNDGFYLLDAGGFFDDHGYLFDKDGFNSIGGFYDPENGEYISPNDFDSDYNAKLEEYYDELCTDSEEEDETGEESFKADVKEHAWLNLTEDDFKNGLIREHCLPVLKWLSEQPSDQMHVVKICNIPRKATQDMLLKKIQKLVKGLSYDKLTVEMDKKSAHNNIGVAYISSNSQETL